MRAGNVLPLQPMPSSLTVTPREAETPTKTGASTLLDAMLAGLTAANRLRIALYRGAQAAQRCMVRLTVAHLAASSARGDPAPLSCPLATYCPCSHAIVPYRDTA